jgi:GTPase SAR1 family protein
LIVVEGPDGSGKTTLVQQLVQDFEGLVEVPKVVSSQAVPMEPMDNYIDKELHRGFGWRVYDRFALISSPFYAMLPRRTFGGDMWNAHWQRSQWYKFKTIDPVIVVCLPSLATVIENVKGVENRVVVKDIEQIYINYVNFFGTQAKNTSCMLWDYHDPNTDQLRGLMNWAKARVAKGR